MTECSILFWSGMVWTVFLFLAGFFIGYFFARDNYKNNRKNVLDELIDFDRWFSGRHVGGLSPIIPEVRQELHRRIAELRKGEQK